MNWQKWIRPGLAATILVALLAVILRSGPIGHELSAEVNARLAAEGHALARRTVAKYRKELGIPSSYRRRKHGA